MFNLIAYSASVALSAVYQNLTAVSDQGQTVSQNGKYIFRRPQRIRLASIVGADIVNARINSPSLRAFILPELDPVNVGAAVPDKPRVIEYDDYALTVLQNEEVGVETSRGAVAAAVNTAGLWISDKWDQAPKGPAFTLVASCANTLVAGGWSLGTLVFNQTLPTGRYAVVGMRTVCPAAAFARLVFPGQNDYRPGCVNDVLYTNSTQPDYFRKGTLGTWGEFDNTAQPNLEIFGLTAGAQTAAAFIDVIKTK